VKLSLSRSQANDSARPDARACETLRRIALALGPVDAGVDVILTDDAFIRDINREYRGVDTPTDVISFSYLEDDGGDTFDGTARDNLAGEIYISCETLEKEATAQGIELKDLFLRIGVHGLLHVLGYRHATDSEAGEMEKEERRLLAAHLAPETVDRLF